MQASDFSSKTAALKQRMEKLRRGVDRSCAPLDVRPGAMPDTVEALEELSVAYEELLQQHDELLTTQRARDAERWRYQELFESAPDGYLVTDAHGIIREANHAAATLLHVPQSFLLDKPLSIFVAQADRKTLRM